MRSAVGRSHAVGGKGLKGDRMKIELKEGMKLRIAKGDTEEGSGLLRQTRLCVVFIAQS